MVISSYNENELQSRISLMSVNRLIITFVYILFMEYKCDRCSSIFTEWYRLEIHRQVHDRKSKIKEYGSPEFNDYRLWHYKQGG